MNIRFSNHAVFPRFLIDLAIFISSKTEVVAGESFERLVTCFLVIL